MLTKLKLAFLVFFVFSSIHVWAKNPCTEQSFQKEFLKYNFNNDSIYQTQTKNVCNTWTFQIKLNSSKSEIPSDLIAIPTNSYILSGSDSIANKINGRLLKVNYQGKVIRSKEISFNQQNVVIKKLRYFSNGNIYALGETLNPTTSIRSPVLLIVDTTDLNIISSFRLSIPVVGGSWNGVDLAEGRENTFSVLLNNDSLINISKLTFRTNVIWSKSIKSKNKPQPISIGNEYWDTYIAYNETDSGFKKGVILNLNYITGNIKYSSKIGGRADNTEYVFQSMSMVNLRPRITALQIKNNIASFIRLNVSPTGIFDYKEIFSVSSFSVSKELVTSQSNWSEVLASTTNNSQSVFLTFTYPDNYYSPIKARKLSYPYPVHLCNIIRTNDGGSLILTEEIGSQQKIILTKIDSAGMLPGCLSTEISATFVAEQQLEQESIVEELDYAIIITPVFFAANDIGTTVIEECRTLYCPDQPSEDTCLRTFFKEYRGYSNSILATGIHKTNSNQLLVIASERENPYVANDNPCLLLFDTAGRFIDNKFFSSETNIKISKTIKLKDGSFIAAGVIYYQYDSSDLYVLKFDEALNLIWQKRMFSTPGYNNIVDILESAENDLYCYLAGSSKISGEKRQLLKLNSAGDPIWLKEYNAGTNIFIGSTEINPRITELGDYIYLKYNEETGDLTPHLIKLRKSDGSIIWVKKYEVNGANTGSIQFNINALISDNTNIYILGRKDTKTIFLKISPDGDIIHSLQVLDNAIYFSNIKYLGAGKLMASISVSNYPSSIHGIVEIDTAFTIIRKQFLQVPKYGAGNDVQNFSDSINYAIGSFSYDNAYWTSFFLQKYNFNSSFASCAVSDPSINFESSPVTIVSKATTVNTLTLPTSVSYNGILSIGTVGYSKYYCGNEPLCQKINLTGKTMICDSINEYTFYTNRNQGCSGIVNWNMDTTINQVNVVSISDSILKLKIKRAGDFTLKAKIFGSCSWLEDSLFISANVNSSSILNLGKDTNFCSGNSITLNAHSGFDSYKWQDESVDSIYIVTKPGKYYVTTSNCAGIQSDTIIVSPHPLIAFDIGPDISMCKNDTITLNAPAGFTNYKWTSYNISSDTGRTVQIFPLINSRYKVTAEEIQGCFVSDSLYVTVKNIPSINLGNDTSLCVNQPITLDAGAGFSTYQWSTGETTQKIIASKSELYTVEAMINECIAYDSLNVLNVYPLPLFSLGNDTTLCQGQLLSFNFNLPQALYEWNNGSTLSNQSINQEGIYWLQVMQQGCTNRDSIKIMFNPFPLIDLGSDTTLCEGSTLRLNAYNNNATYYWQDGSTMPDYLVRRAGIYYVSMNINGCTAADTININYKQLPYFILGKDSTICDNQEIVLNPLINTTANYLWQDGSHRSNFTVQKEGTYILTTSNECGSYTDSITIATGFCSIEIPSAFTPNNDGINDLFRANHLFEAKQFQMSIYNRFGQKVFESNNINEGWNGTFKGVQAPVSSYVWMISFTDINNKPQHLKGIITLVR